jgi:type I restriction enzyme S subunit
MKKKVKLGSIIELKYGKALCDADRDINGAYGAYGANGIKAKTNKYLYDKPSIIVGRKGSAGELTLVKEKFWALDVSYYVTHDEKETDLIYIFYALKKLNLPSLAKGIKPGLNRDEAYALDVNLPSLAEQKDIVRKLDAVFRELGKIEELTRAKAIELDSLGVALLNKLLA